MNNQWPKLFVKTSTGAINSWEIWTEGPEICMRWGKLDGAMQTSRTPAVGKNEGKANETTAKEQAVKEAESRFNKQLRLKYVRSIDEACVNINIKPMKAYELDEKRLQKLPWPVTGQPKFDGCRCMAYLNADGSVRLMSRGGLDYEIAHIKEELTGKIESGWCLDGEIYCHGMNLQTIRHHIETPSDEQKQLSFVVYDMTQLSATDTPWSVRQQNLNNWFWVNLEKLRSIKLSPSLIIHNFEQLEQAHNNWVTDGYEGLMVRLNHGFYKLAARSREVLKYKKFQDDEFKVIDWSLGKDGIIQYTCIQEDGIEFDARPVGSDEERERLLEEAKAGKAVGQLLTVRFMGRSKDNVPLMGVGVAFRPTKDMD